MLDDIFLKILDMSVTSGIVILFVLIARLLLKKAPKVFSYALWAVVLFRLICPFSFESVISLLPEKSEPVTPEILYSQDFIPPPAEEFPTDFEEWENGGFDLTPIVPEIPETPAEPEVNIPQILTFSAIILWLAGIAALLIYSGISLIKLKKRLNSSSNSEGNVYISEHLETPFVIGVLRPRIYLPANLSEEETRYILLHERTHIKRLDHIVKIVSYLALCVHWFNPLVWIAFFLSGKDMEMSCDEAVIGQLGGEVKKDYSSSLLALATGKRIVGGSPLAFGEGSTKNRIKNVLSYKKPAFWVIIAALVGVTVLTAGLVTNPVSGKNAKIDLADIEGMNIGAEMPDFLYCDKDKAVFQGTCGVIVYDFDKAEVTDRIAYETFAEKGFTFPYVFSSPDGKNLYIGENNYINGGETLFTYKYNLKSKKFKEISPINPRDAEHFTPSELGNVSQYLYTDCVMSWTKGDISDTEFVYLRLKPESWSVNKLQLVRCNTETGLSTVYNLWDSGNSFTVNTDDLVNNGAWEADVSEPRDFWILPDHEHPGFAAHYEEKDSCEYGYQNNGLTVQQMRNTLDYKKGLYFTEKEAEEKYVIFIAANDKKTIQSISLSCFTDSTGLKQYPMDTEDYRRFKVPAEKGIYDFFAAINLDDGTTDSVYFRVTVGEIRTRDDFYEVTVMENGDVQLGIYSTEEFPEFGEENVGFAYYEKAKNQLHFGITTAFGHPNPDEVEGPLGSLAGAGVKFDFDLTEKKILSSEFEEGASPEKIKLDISEERLAEIALALMDIIEEKSKAPAYNIMTEEVGAIGCEYGVNINNELDTVGMLVKLDEMQGFNFSEYDAKNLYVSISLKKDAPKQIKGVALRYSSVPLNADINQIDSAEITQYPVDSRTGRFKVPSETGIYNFFADITWIDNSTETAYFRITVGALPSTADNVGISPLEFLSKLRDSMVIEENNGELYAKMTVPPVLPDGFTTNDIDIAFDADKDGRTTNFLDSYTRTHLEKGKTYSLKIDAKLDKSYRVTRDVSLTRDGQFMPACQLRDSYDYSSDSAEVRNALEEIYNSISFNGGKASITIPKNLPEGVSADKMTKFFRITFPYDGLNIVQQVLFEDTKFEAGKTYTENLGEKFYSGTQATIELAFGNEKSSAKIFMDYYPEAEFKIPEKSGVTIEQAKDKLAAVLKKNLPDEPEWELDKNGSPCVINGRHAFAFKQYRVNGALINTYAITDDFRKLYRAEYNHSPVVWQELKFDMNADSANISPIQFLNQLRDSMIIEEKGGELYAKMTVPDVIPKGYNVNGDSIGFYAYDINDRYGKTNVLFKNHPQLSNGAYNLEAGKTYTQKVNGKLDKNTVLRRVAGFEPIDYGTVNYYGVNDDSLYKTSNEKEQAFLEGIYNSISVKNGKAAITIPKNIPAGCSIEDLDISIYLRYPSTDSSGETQDLFKDVKFAAGKTYTENLSQKLYNGTVLSIDLSVTGGRFKELDRAIARINAYVYPAPEAVFNKDEQLIAKANKKLSAILENAFEENNWVLENGKKTTVDGETAYAFDLRFKKEVPVMGGRLTGYYAISEDFTKVYEVDGISGKSALKYDLMKSTPELEKLVEEIYDSMTIENGTAKIVIPKKLPKGYSGENISIDFTVTYPNNTIDHPFRNQTYEAGKTYTGKLTGNIADCSSVYRNVSVIVEGKTVARKFKVQEYPIREDDYTPKAEILTNGVNFTDKYGDTFKVTMNLPAGWSLKESSSADSVDVYKDGNKIGELFYSDFKLYEGVTEENYYMSVYSGIMLGSVISWDNEYKVISKTDNVYIETCRPRYTESNGGADRVTTYRKGILSHDRTLLKYMAMSFEENVPTDEEWVTLAKSIKLSGTKK